jgi:two-component system chemotaxis sensor kinase CheA
MSNEHAEIFKEEAGELLEELETSLLELEKNTRDEELTRKIFRALHTIKGSGAMFGFDEISGFSHELENVFDAVRKGTAVVTKDLIDLSLSAVDVIKKMLEGAPDQNLDTQRQEILARIKQPAAGEEEKKAEPPAEAPESAEKEPMPEMTYRIRFKPSFEIQQKGTDLIDILNELRALGYGEVVAHVWDVPLLEDIVPDGCYVYWDIILTTSAGINAIKDVFILIEDEAEIKIDIIDEGKGLEEEEDYKKLGYILVERGDLTPEEMDRVLHSKKLFGELLVEEGLVESEKIQSALLEQKHVRELRDKRQKEEAVSTLKVPSDKADKLVNLVGELVTLQARLGQLSEHLDDPDLLSVSEEAERLVWDLRDSTMSIRMVPIGTCFTRFNRLVRDLSNELGKKARLTAVGEETELDKTVIERLGDPLVHLIRNCLDHGIEAPGKREKLGKPGVGTIHLSASYAGAYVIIVIEDDGSGIDPGAIKARALERGLIKPGAELSEKELFNLLFEPGFSTAREVTSVSGRGVGLDVVKKNIEALRGTIQVDSEKRKGTMITLKIPLTLAIIDGLLATISGENFIFPLSMVEEIVELTTGGVTKTHGRNITNIRGRIVPYVILREQFEIDGQVPEIQQIVVVEVEHRKIGFVVDQVIGKHQTVIKSLGKVYQNAKGLSGATILGDGTVALILDVSTLAQVAEIQEQEFFE